ncbi:MAG: bifunctional oligoribonuclease/PAP phosphatase NrnA [Gorillibacterium sp.]|nr:bifunctional oligoribonuclease/PAP phosphatase NrnA [Gorillibacterium sp.]
MSPTRLPFSEQLAEASRFILKGDYFLVVSHVNPDGDAISSTLAVGEMLAQLGKHYILINDNSIPDKFVFLMGNRQIADYSTKPQLQFERIITVDCADFQRVGSMKELFTAGIPLLNIDHHPTNDYFGFAQLIQPEAAATVEILYGLIQELGTSWNQELASFIYTGLLTDTGGFRYANTTSHVMRIAAEMLDHGAMGNEIADRLLERLTMPQVLLLQKALISLSFALHGQVSWLSVSHEDIGELHVSNEDMDGLVNYPRNISGVEVGMLFKETAPNQFKVSMRSAGKVNVAEIAHFFGGGGHIRASGCTVEGSFLDEVVSKVLKEVGRALL